MHHLVTFVASIAIAFWRGWKLTLVMLAVMPLIAVAGGILAKVLTWGTSRRAEAYEKANVVASQSISNIRTVASFQAEEPIYKRFSDMLDYPRRISAKLALYNGMAGGSINLAVFLACDPYPPEALICCMSSVPSTGVGIRLRLSGGACGH